MRVRPFFRRLNHTAGKIFSRFFRSNLRPVELGRQVGQLLDEGRTVDTRGYMIVPNHLTYALAHEDRHRFTPIEETLRREIIEVMRDHVKTNNYRFSGPVSVAFVTNPNFRLGKFEMSGEYRQRSSAEKGYLIAAEGTRIKIKVPQLLGRADECGVILQGSNVSRHHAEIRLDDQGLFLVDLGSTNGTLLNGIAVDSQRLIDGDIIMIGEHQLRLEVS